MKFRIRALLRRTMAPLRREGTRLRVVVVIRPVATFLVLGVTLGVLAFGWNLVRTPAEATPTIVDTVPPAATYVGSWDLLQLTQHLQAGDVLRISRFQEPVTGPAARPGVATALAAETTDQQWIKLDLEQTPNEAVGALRALGYGRLLTAEALSALPTASAALTPPTAPDPISNFLMVGMALMLGGAVITFMIRSTRNNGPMGATNGRPGQGGSRGHFTVILPPDPAMAEDGTVADRLSHLPRLADIAGVDEAKFELTEVIDFLKDPEPFAAMGATIPRGVLLYGPPGTGKTSLAKAVAREAGVTFIHTSGADFVEMYVGVGAKRIRELFIEARKFGRAVIFVDEFDALGKARGGPQSHDEREQTLNQLLKELDGFDTTSGVVVLAATNRIDTLDSAVLRPGRFGRKVNVPNPDREGREAILAVHAANKPLAPTVDLKAVARQTFGFSGAMLADILNEAAILAARRKAQFIEQADLAAGWLKVAMGVSRSRSMDNRERSIIAVHEAGHAICGRIHGDRRRIEKISLRAHGEALGFTAFSSEDDSLPAESNLRARLIALMGGRAAESMMFHEITGGAADDFKNAHSLAETMVRQLGMGRDPADTGPAGVSGRGVLSFLVQREGQATTASVAEAQSRAIAAILDEAYAAALATLSGEQQRLETVAAYLYEAEEIDGDEFDSLMDGRLTPVSLTAWRAEPAHPRSPQEIADVLANRRAASVGPAQPRIEPARPALRPLPSFPAPAPMIVPAPIAIRNSHRRPSLSGIIGGRLRRRTIAALQAWEDRGKDKEPSR